MHEISLARNIFNTLQDEFPDKFDSIQTIYLNAGELSNVQPLLMESAFAAVLEDEPKYRHTKLQVNVLPIIVQCDVCNTQSTVKQYKFICSNCGSACKKIIQGDELLISKVEFSDAQ